MDPEHYTEIFRSVLAGRKWIVATEVAAGATGTVAWLREHGAPDPFVISGSPGTGELPDLPEANIVMLGTAGASLMDSMRNFYRAVYAPLPSEAKRRLDDWDPNGRARVFSSFLDEDRPICERPQFGARPAAWRDLEDKTVIDGFWDEVGVDRAPSRIVRLDARQLKAALAELDRGSGIVVTGDNRRGWHGGAEYTRVARTPADVQPILDFLRPRCHRARAMPFLEGIPCSIHGVVFPGHVLTVRPVEMLVLYEPTRNRFRYASAARTWEAPPADADRMRRVATRVGARLRAVLGYRGAFTIDGVLTRAGFLPTELNPRAGAGLRVITTEPPDAFALHTFLISGIGADWQPRRLEEHWRSHSRDPRPGRGYTVVEKRFTETETVPVRHEAGAWSPVDKESSANGTLRRGPAGAGGLVGIDFEAGVVEQGESAAPVVAAGFALADALWDTNIGPLVPAAAVRA